MATSIPTQREWQLGAQVAEAEAAPLKKRARLNMVAKGAVSSGDSHRARETWTRCRPCWRPTAPAARDQPGIAWTDRSCNPATGPPGSARSRTR
jgi:hypothetical protein